MHGCVCDFNLGIIFSLIIASTRHCLWLFDDCVLALPWQVTGPPGKYHSFFRGKFFFFLKLIKFQCPFQ